MVFESDAAVVGDGDAEAVDAPGLVGSAAVAQPGAGESPDAVELLGVDRFERSAVAPRAAGLDLADDDGVAVAGDEVELAEPVAPVALDQLHAVPAQVGRGVALAEASQLMGAGAAQAHGRGSSRTWPLPKSRSGSR
ncbi:hypothetical protein GCM10027447_09740 [Glycomyces halotolerans]